MFESFGASTRVPLLRVPRNEDVNFWPCPPLRQGHDAGRPVYHQTREALEEHGMEVTRELRDMNRLAQYGDRLSSLPIRQQRFVGRADELALVDSVARSAVDGGPAVLWISGMPGVGKTALAVNAAHRLVEVFPDGRLFVDLTGFTPNVAPIDPAAALERLLTDLGVPPEAIPPSTTARAELYRSTLADTRTLVVLDNARTDLPQGPTTRNSGAGPFGWF
jgi:hypothetical protein